MHELQRLIQDHLPPGPEGFLAARVHRLLSHDPTLRAIFRERIQLLPEFWPFDYEDLPKLQVAATLSQSPEEAPGQREERPVEITVRVLYEATQWAPIYSGPSPNSDITQEVAVMADLGQYIMNLLKNSRELPEGSEKMIQPGKTVYEPLPTEPVVYQDGPTIFYSDVRVTFTTRIDPKTGQIDNLAQARA